MLDRADLLLLIGAMVILGYLSLNVNHFLLTNTKVKTRTEIQYTGIALGQNIIDSARWLTFAAIDRYSGYSKVDTAKHAIYTVSAKLYYVTDANPDQPAGIATNHKRLDVKITSSGLAHPIVLSYIKNQ